MIHCGQFYYFLTSLLLVLYFFLVQVRTQQYHVEVHRDW